MIKYRLTKPGKIIFFNFAFTFFIFSLLFFSGFVQAVIVNNPVVSNSNPEPGVVITFNGSIEIETNEKLPINTITFTIKKHNGSHYIANQTCIYNYTSKAKISGCTRFSNFNTNYTFKSLGYGYDKNEGNIFGYQQNYHSGTIHYSVDWMTFETDLDLKMSMTPTLMAKGNNQQSKNYSSSLPINFTITPSSIDVNSTNLTLLTDSGIFAVPGNNFENAPYINVTKEVVIFVDNDTTIILPVGNITGDSFINISKLLAELVSKNSVFGLSNIQKVLKWGESGNTLSFNPAIEIRLKVGTSLNGQTLSLRRSTNGMTWTSSGMVDKTCVVFLGFCTFTVDKASYYAAYIPSSVSSSSGSSGSSGFDEFEAWYFTRHLPTLAEVVVEEKQIEKTQTLGEVKLRPGEEEIIVEKTNAVVKETTHLDESSNKWDALIIIFLISVCGLAIFFNITTKKKQNIYK